MPRKAKYTKEDLIQTALDITREEGIEGVVARNLGKRLGTGATTIFTHFQSVEDIKMAVMEEITKLYNSYILEGLSMQPPFKGYAIKYIQFAMDEPMFFKLLFMNKSDVRDIHSFILLEKQYEHIIGVIMDTFHIGKKEAEWVEENMILYGYGIACMCATNSMKITLEEASIRFGRVCRALLMEMQSVDTRSKIVPAKDMKIEGNVDDYMK